MKRAGKINEFSKQFSLSASFRDLAENMNLLAEKKRLQNFVVGAENCPFSKSFFFHLTIPFQSPSSLERLCATFLRSKSEENPQGIAY